MKYNECESQLVLLLYVFYIFTKDVAVTNVSFKRKIPILNSVLKTNFPFYTLLIQ